MVVRNSQADRRHVSSSGCRLDLRCSFIPFQFLRPCVWRSFALICLYWPLVAFLTGTYSSLTFILWFTHGHKSIWFGLAIFSIMHLHWFQNVLSYLTILSRTAILTCGLLVLYWRSLFAPIHRLHWSLPEKQNYAFIGDVLNVSLYLTIYTRLKSAIRLKFTNKRSPDRDYFLG